MRYTMSRSVFRKPSLKKSLSAKYKGAYKRKLKRVLIPGYGTRKAGWLHPKRKMYNKLYYRTSLDTRKVITGQYKSRPGTGRIKQNRTQSQHKTSENEINPKVYHRLNINNSFKEGTIDSNPHLVPFIAFCVWLHTICYYIWRIAFALMIIFAFIGLTWLVSLNIFLMFIGIIMRLVMPLIVNVLDIFVKAPANYNKKSTYQKANVPIQKTENISTTSKSNVRTPNVPQQVENKQSATQKNNQIKKYFDIYKYLHHHVNSIPKNNKLINSSTGYPLAKKSSISRTRDELEQILSYPEEDYIEMAKYDSDEKTTIDMYLTSIYLPYYFAGILAYKQGDWNKAEKWWLSVLNLKPFIVSNKLAIMYRKQHRYQDVLTMYQNAIQFANEPLLSISDGEYQQLADEMKKAGETAAKHQNIDKSTGVQSYSNKADMKFMMKLKELSAR